MRFQKRSHLHDVKVPGEPASADAEAEGRSAQDLANSQNWLC